MHDVEELLAAFGRHLALQRGLSEHTVRGYLSDVRALLGTLNEDGASSPAGDGTSRERGSGDAGVELVPQFIKHGPLVHG